MPTFFPNLADPLSPGFCALRPNFLEPVSFRVKLLECFFFPGFFHPALPFLIAPLSLLYQRLSFFYTERKIFLPPPPPFSLRVTYSCVLACSFLFPPSTANPFATVLLSFFSAQHFFSPKSCSLGNGAMLFLRSSRIFGSLTPFLHTSPQ